MAAVVALTDVGTKVMDIVDGTDNRFNDATKFGDFETDDDNKMKTIPVNYIWYIPSSDNKGVKYRKRVFWSKYNKEEISTDDDDRLPFLDPSQDESLLSGDTDITYGSQPIPDLDALKGEFIKIYEPQEYYCSTMGLNHLRNMSVPFYFDKIHYNSNQK